MAQAPAQPTEADLRELMMRSEAVRQQISMLEQQREILLEVSQEATRSLTTLQGLEQAKDGDELLVPIGAGTFLHARLDQAGRALTSLGSNLHAEVTLADAAARLRERMENLNATNQRLASELNRLLDEMARLNAVLESAQGA